MRRIVNRTSDIFGIIGGTAIAIMMTHVVIDVALRASRGQGLRGTFEYAQFWWMPLIAYGGLAYAQRRDEHIAAPIIFDRLSQAGQGIWASFAALITVTVLLLMAIYGWRAAASYQAAGEVGGATQIPVWPIRYAVPIGALAYALQITIDAIQEVTAPNCRAGHGPDDPTLAVE